jgi:hypothetical protein
LICAASIPPWSSGQTDIAMKLDCKHDVVS